MFNVEYSGTLAHWSLLGYMIDTMIRIPDVECYFDGEKIENLFLWMFIERE